jgi:hypothetical protein
MVHDADARLGSAHQGSTSTPNPFPTITLLDNRYLLRKWMSLSGQ